MFFRVRVVIGGARPFGLERAMSYRSLILVAAAFVVSSCEQLPQPNQVSPLRSPSGAYVAEVPVVAVTGRDFGSYWTPRLSDAEGRRIYEDTDGFPARFNVYWKWDSDDRLWLYNSDDGAVWLYELTGGSGHFFKRRAEEPPPGLVP